MIDAPAFKEPAACDDMDPDLWFPEPGDHGRAAKWICNNRCPARDECLAWALTAREPFGIWGGLSSAERENLRRRSTTPPPPPRPTPTGRRKPLTPEQRQEVLDLSAAGRSAAEIAAEVGTTARSVTRIRAQARESA